MGEPLWISHRGSRIGGMENSREAFAAAVGLGFTALETDLRLTADGEIVLCHDPDLSRLGGGSTPLVKRTRADLERQTLAGGAKLMFFEQFLAAFPQCTWTFDIKPETATGVLAAIQAMISRRAFGDWLRAQAKWLLWRRPDERQLEAILPGCELYAREGQCWQAGLAVLAGLSGLSGIRRGRIYALPPRALGMDLFRPEVVAAYHERGARVVAYLPKDRDEAVAACAAGVDEVLTNGLIVA